MVVNWGDIFEAIYLCSADTTMANAFRKAAGLPTKHKRTELIAFDRDSAYAGVDFEKLMGQRHGVRL